MTDQQPTPKPTPPASSAAPHVLHVTAHGMHLHWAPRSSRDEIERTGIAARAFAGRDLVRKPTDTLPMVHALGRYRFGVDDDGNAIIGGRIGA